jgi:hypothetical protein
MTARVTPAVLLAMIMQLDTVNLAATITIILTLILTLTLTLTLTHTLTITMIDVTRTITVLQKSRRVSNHRNTAISCACEEKCMH